MEDKKIIVVYKSKSGFTKKYAQWIANDLHCDLVCLENCNITEIERYDVVIFGGGLHAGKINGIKFIQKKIPLLAGKEIIVFATGATAPIPEEIERFKKDNIPQDLDITFFYFQSGLKYASMSVTDKLLMGGLKTFLKAKKPKTDTEQGTLDSIQSSYDYSNHSQIGPLINYIKGT